MNNNNQSLPRHPVLTQDDWRREVQAGDTILGYADWVDHRLESAADDMHAALLKTYRVRIKATVTKDIVVEAADEDEAGEIASGEFSASFDGTEEDYWEDVLNIQEEPQESESE